MTRRDTSRDYKVLILQGIALFFRCQARAVKQEVRGKEAWGSFTSSVPFMTKLKLRKVSFQGTCLIQPDYPFEFSAVLLM